jgi:hemin uptake protein HemP
MAASGDCDTRDKAKNPSSLSVPRIPLSDLLGGGREAILVHDGAEYRLRLTSNGKLILTK